MAHALFEILSGRFADGAPLAGAGTEATRRSVQDHVRRLLNGRAGVLPHLPDHGLPDLPALYADLPYSLDRVADAVRAVVQRFEPRLEQVQVRLQPQTSRQGVLALELSGRLPGGEPVRLISVLRADGSAHLVSPVPPGGH